MSRASYPSYLTAKPMGIHVRPTCACVINAILYLDRTGGQWRALPHDFPTWSTVWSYFHTWRNDGTWKRIHTALREKTRMKQGRDYCTNGILVLECVLQSRR